MRGRTGVSESLWTQVQIGHGVQGQLGMRGEDMSALMKDSLPHWNVCLSFKRSGTATARWPS